MMWKGSRLVLGAVSALYLLVEKPVDRYRQALARGRTKENGRVSRPSS